MASALKTESNDWQANVVVVKGELNSIANTLAFAPERLDETLTFLLRHDAARQGQPLPPRTPQLWTPLGYRPRREGDDLGFMALTGPNWLGRD